jgi:hypothetical protein
MAGVEALGGAVTWAEVGSIFAAVGALGTALYGSFATKFKTDDNAKAIEALMSRVQELSDNKAGRDEMRAAVTDIKETMARSIEAMERKIDASDSRVERTVTTLSSALTAQISTLGSRIDAMMTRSRAHAS